MLGQVLIPFLSLSVKQGAVHRLKILFGFAGLKVAKLHENLSLKRDKRLW